MHTDIETMLDANQAEQVWHRLWLYGIIVDDDLSYYVPDDYDTEVSLICLDGPNRAQA